MRIANRHAVDVAADLDADHAQYLDGVAQLGNRQVQLLQRDRAHAYECALGLGGHGRYLFVQKAQQLLRLGRFEPVGEQLGHW